MTDLSRARAEPPVQSEAEGLRTTTEERQKWLEHYDKHGTIAAKVGRLLIDDVNGLLAQHRAHAEEVERLTRERDEARAGDSPIINAAGETLMWPAGDEMEPLTWRRRCEIEKAAFISAKRRAEAAEAKLAATPPNASAAEVTEAVGPDGLTKAELEGWSDAASFRQMLVECARFASWAAGEGICPSEGEPATPPEDFLVVYSTSTGFEDWEHLADHVEAVFAKGGAATSVMEALERILAANDEFRAEMPLDRDLDPLDVACDEARAALAKADAGGAIAFAKPGAEFGFDTVSSAIRAAYEAGHRDAGGRPGPVVGDVTCPDCDGRGWLGACRGSQFAYIGKLASSGRLPKRDCPKCNGTGQTPKPDAGSRGEANAGGWRLPEGPFVPPEGSRERNRLQAYPLVIRAFEPPEGDGFGPLRIVMTFENSITASLGKSGAELLRTFIDQVLPREPAPPQQPKQDGRPPQ